MWNLASAREEGEGMLDDAHVDFLEDQPFAPSERSEEEIHNGPENGTMDIVTNDSRADADDSADDISHDGIKNSFVVDVKSIIQSKQTSTHIIAASLTCRWQ
jgi:hypothetical protein